MGQLNILSQLSGAHVVPDIQQRYVLAFVAFLGVVHSYIMRFCIAYGLRRMSKSKTLSFTEVYDWSPHERGLVKSIFFIGYIIGHSPGAYLAERFGGKIVLNLGLLATAICTFITPFVVQAGGSVGLIVLRFVMGLGEAPTFPALGSMLSAWFPVKERGVLAAFVLGGVQMGSVLVNLLSGVILGHTEGYGYLFFIYGIIGFAWNVLFHFTTSDRPETHPRISDEEREYLRNEIGQLAKKEHFFDVPWTSLLSSGPVWALIVAQMGHDWGLFYMILAMPEYFSEVLNIHIDGVGYYASLPYLFCWILSILTGSLGDFLINHKKLTRTQSRKMFTFIATVIPGMFIVAASYANYNKPVVITLFGLAMGSMGAFYAGNRVNVLDICPNYTATLLGLVNGLGGIGGFISPYLGELLTPNGTLLEWRLTYWITFAILTLTTVFYLSLASGEVQSWNDNTNEDNWLRRLCNRCYSRKAAKTDSKIEPKTEENIINTKIKPSA